MSPSQASTDEYCTWQTCSALHTASEAEPGAVPRLLFAAAIGGAAFTEKLPETAAELYANDALGDELAAAGRLPKSSIDAEFYELEAGRHVPPDRVGAAQPPARRVVTRWILSRPETLTEIEQLRLKTVLANCPELDALTGHVRSFAQMLTEHQDEQLP